MHGLWSTFRHWVCPLGNKPPEGTTLFTKATGNWLYRLLNSTNDFPIYRDICPASARRPVLNLAEHEPTTNREDECAITEHAVEENYVRVDVYLNAMVRVAVIGAGPAGLATANQLNLKGYTVTVYDKNRTPADCSATVF